MTLIDVAIQIERWAGTAIFVLASLLAYLSLRAWQRERRRRLVYVAAAYALFATFGLAVAAERTIMTYYSFELAELIEHTALVLILVGLLAFFVALGRD